MAEISWIKLSVNIFDDEKIKLIKKMPEGNSILLIWIQLLCLAGKTNDGGSVYMGQNMYYTDEMLATICDQPLANIRLALNTFQSFGMIEAQADGLIVIENWEKHQNIAGMDKVREQNRLRKQRQREREKIKALECDFVTSRDCHVTEEDIDKNKNKIKNKNTNSDVYESILDSWNALDKNISNITTINQGTTRHKQLTARINQYGADKVFEAIEKINDSNFLKGYVSDFKVTFDWFVKPNNFIKVLEGNYNDRASIKKKGFIQTNQVDREERIKYTHSKLQQGLSFKPSED